MHSISSILAGIVFGLCLLVTGFAPVRSVAQDVPVRETFYSGTVLEFSDDKVTVSRAVLGKAAENRTFQINSETKIEGKLRAKSRVTVRFTTRESVDVALSILVRDRPEREPKKK